MSPASPFKVALLCGGPSLERGISLNSARSVCDHLRSESLMIQPIYFDSLGSAYNISPAQLYSNTPSDFDFKLATSGKALTDQALARALKSCDLVFPVMHGPFGEDGQIQRLLEEIGCPYVGSDSTSCELSFDKHTSSNFIAENGFEHVPSLLLTPRKKERLKAIRAFFKEHKIKRAIVKPATGGSSIAVYSVDTPEQALECAKTIFSARVDKRVVVEPFCTGREFTVIILQNRFGQPVSIIPTEIDLDYRDHQIFDYRRKYLATRQVTYHCPPNFSDEVVEKIQIQAEQLFSLFGLRDFARFDGWLFEDGRIAFSDFNPISGMEQNSFLFMQSAQLGMSHGDLLRYVLKSACRRYDMTLPSGQIRKKSRKKKEINILFGGRTAERQVSLMSGTNVWLKLRRSDKFEPHPHLLDTRGDVWRLPYGFALNHTVEEIEFACKQAEQVAGRNSILANRAITKLAPEAGDISESQTLPTKMSLNEFIKQSERVFIGLHGGIGEDGQLQKRLEGANIYFNGPSSRASRVCMDKHLTGEVTLSLQDEYLLSAKRKRTRLSSFKKFKKPDFRKYWNKLVDQLDSESVIVKPLGDGCSAGIARLYTAGDLRTYCRFALEKSPFIPNGSLTDQHGIIDMPTEGLKDLLFEEFIITDRVVTENNELKITNNSGWTEVTVGVLEEGGKLSALSPSITVAEGNVLSLEEKFQGGTGVNITPPPKELVSTLALKTAKKKIEKLAKALGLQGYSRIDAFLHRSSGKLIIIEVNTLPGLTGSTVIFHQALAEKPPMFPVEFLEKIVAAGEQRYKRTPKGVKLPKVISI